MGRNRLGQFSSARDHPGRSRNPSSGGNPRKVKRTLAQEQLFQRASAKNLLVGETFQGGDGMDWVVIEAFGDGSSTVRRSDGLVVALKASDTIKLTQASALRDWTP